MQGSRISIVSSQHALVVRSTRTHSLKITTSNTNTFEHQHSNTGVSARFSRPWYRDRVVPNYIETYCDDITHMFNTSGRGYPDISAVGQNVPSAWLGRIQPAGGTSSSAPIVAGILSLLNGERLRETTF